MSSAPISPDFEEELRSLLAEGRKIEAIKRYREETGAGLADAKNAVEALERGAEIPPTGAKPTSCGAVGCLFVGLLLAAGVVAVLFTMRPVPKAIRVDLAGTPGTTVKGEYVVGGVTHFVSGVVPMSFEVRAAQVSYRVKKADVDGELTGIISIDGFAEGNSSTSAAFGGVSGEVKLGSRLFPKKLVGVNTFSDEGK